MRIRTDSQTPIFEQIADGVRGLIASGVHKPGEGLPSLRAFAKKLGVNPNTVQRAYELLEREGFIVTRRGLGVFVSERGKADAILKAESAFQSEIRTSIEKAAASSVSVSTMRRLFREESERILAKSK
ncbi:MAG: GntR family transcriptional regulator [Planctomycetales bacterium]|nr:GntR family transcriptional regulator [Planctomycetales bacterium]